LVKEINNKYGTPLWKPIIYIKSQVSHATLHAIRRVANFCIVSSLHDGMNLVAKEFVSSRIDKDGVLILSQFTGAAEELTDALIINPYAIDDFALKIKEALEMPEEERKERMGRMREVVQQNDIYHWAFSIISDLTKIKP
jgi:trehalose 6-phosphate synthase